LKMDLVSIKDPESTQFTLCAMNQPQTSKRSSFF
jgi:hypothetical protein